MVRTARTFLIVLALMLVGWSWPPQWSPEGKEVMKVELGNITISTGDVYGIKFEVWSDGTAVYSINDGKRSYRPMIIDHFPDKPCEWLRKDLGVLEMNGTRMIQREQWRDSEWKLMPPIDERCFSNTAPQAWEDTIP